MRFSGNEILWVSFRSFCKKTLKKTTILDCVLNFHIINDRADIFLIAHNNKFGTTLEWIETHTFERGEHAWGKTKCPPMEANSQSVRRFRLTPVGKKDARNPRKDIMAIGKRYATINGQKNVENDIGTVGQKIWVGHEKKYWFKSNPPKKHFQPEIWPSDEFTKYNVVHRRDHQVQGPWNHLKSPNNTVIRPSKQDKTQKSKRTNKNTRSWQVLDFG